MKALRKDTIMEIRSSFTRLLSLIIMIMIGVAVFVGLKVTGPAMVRTADDFLNQSNYQDIAISSTYGLDEKDLEQLNKKTGVEKLEYGYHADLLLADKDKVIRIQNMNEGISLTQVKEGKIPEKKGEILLDVEMKKDYKIGDKIIFQKEEKVEGENPLLDQYEYTITGFGINPEYFTEGDKGSTAVGDGSISGFGVVFKDHFQRDKYSIARFRFENLIGLSTVDPLYNRRVQNHQTEFEKLLRDRPKKKYDAMILDLNEGIQEGKEEIQKGKQDLEDGEQKIVDAQKEIDDGRTALENQKANVVAMGMNIPPALIAQENALNDAQGELEENKKEFQEEKEKADREMKDAAEKMTDARKIRSMLIEPVYDRSSRLDESALYGYYVQGENLNIISNIFPVFFFFIAMLVSLTTMTRMIDEQRIQIGTLKALGYKNVQIGMKYLIYGAVASLIGSALGVAFGHKIISPLIADAYNTGFIMEGLNNPWRWDINGAALLIGLLCTSGVAYLVVKNTLREKAAILLRGKAPKGGTRIFLERIRPLWNRLTFLQKVTMRNIFRYKRRMFMTIIGVAGCTALIFLGFGIRDSVLDTMEKQFSEITKYNFISLYNDKIPAEDLKKYEEKLSSDKRIIKSDKIYMDSWKRNNEEGITQNITVIAPEKPEDFHEYMDIRSLYHEDLKIALGDEGVVLSKKLADVFDVAEGEIFRVYDGQGKPIDLKVSNICEFYIEHYLFATPKYLNTVMDTEVKMNGDMALTDNITKEDTKDLLREIMGYEGVVGTVNVETFKGYTDDLVKSIDILVYVIVIAASLLAFVVLYNLTNINISERLRELSTIKVLGFYPKEVTAYVYRETTLLTILGIFVGYFIGFLMHRIVIDFLLGDSRMMSGNLHLATFLLSAVITLLFSIVVMLIVHRMLKRIDMVEALKAIE